jgi:predicted ATPase
MERVNRLPEREREVLEMASVLGEVFNVELLRASLGWEHAPLWEALADCAARRFFLPLSSDSPTQRFHHPKIREAVLDRISHLRLVDLNRKVALALMMEPASNVVSIAYHASLGEMDEKAIPYLVQAGEQLESQFALAEAAWYYERARKHFHRLQQPLTETWWEERNNVLNHLASLYRDLDEHELEIQAREEAFAVILAQVAMRKKWEGEAPAERPPNGRVRLPPNTRRTGEWESRKARVRNKSWLTCKPNP